jgi:hypothetical protein
MGCGTCRVVIDELQDRPLDYNLEKLKFSSDIYLTNRIISEIESMNNHYARASNILQVIENIRQEIFDKLDKLILETGACCFTKPTIESCIKCLFWKISADLYGNIKKADFRFFEDEPFIEIKAKDISEQGTLMTNLISNYISELMNSRGTLKRTDREIPELVYIISKEYVEIDIKM